MSLDVLVPVRLLQALGKKAGVPGLGWAWPPGGREGSRGGLVPGPGDWGLGCIAAAQRTPYPRSTHSCAWAWGCSRSSLPVPSTSSSSAPWTSRPGSAPCSRACPSSTWRGSWGPRTLVGATARSCRGPCCARPWGTPASSGRRPFSTVRVGDVICCLVLFGRPPPRAPAGRGWDAGGGGVTPQQNALGSPGP